MLCITHLVCRWMTVMCGSCSCLWWLAWRSLLGSSTSPRPGISATQAPSWSRSRPGGWFLTPVRMASWQRTLSTWSADPSKAGLFQEDARWWSNEEEIQNTFIVSQQDGCNFSNISNEIVKTLFLINIIFPQTFCFCLVSRSWSGAGLPLSVGNLSPYPVAKFLFFLPHVIQESKAKYCKVVCYQPEVLTGLYLLS